MKYEDEKIAEFKKEQHRQTYRDITEEGVYIKDRLVRFLPRKIIEPIEVYMPEEFIDMPQEMQILKYPSLNRPQKVFTSLEGSVNFAFNFIESKTPSEQAGIVMGQLQGVIRKVNPAIVFYQEITKNLENGRPVCMFDFKNFGIDDQIYNMMCIAALNCGTLHATFNCLDRDSEEWKNAAWQVFQTIRE